MLRSKSVEQLINVLIRFRVRNSSGESVIKAYQGAIDDVRKKYNVAYQTIGDLCRRRLSLGSINDFYNLLEKWVSGDPNPLMNLITHNAEHHDHPMIKEFFLKEGGHNSGAAIRVKLESLAIHLDQDTAKKLKVLSIINEDPSHTWLNEEISKIIDEKYREWLSRQNM